jgi:transposase
MSIRYDENTKARAVRLVCEHRDDYDREWAAIQAISGPLEMNPGTPEDSTLQYITTRR